MASRENYAFAPIFSPLRKQPVNSIGGLQSDYIRLIVRIVIRQRKRALDCWTQKIISSARCSFVIYGSR
jgi:hypothetical protein